MPTNPYRSTLDPRQRLTRDAPAGGGIDPNTGEVLPFDPNRAPGSTADTDEDYFMEAPTGGAAGFQSPTSVTGPEDMTNQEQWRYWGGGFGPGGMFSAPAPQSEYVAQSMGIDPNAIPQVAGERVASSYVTAPQQDWSARYANDYAASLAPLAATAAQRGHMQDVAAGRAGPSLAELQLQQGQETAAANALGAALTGRGGTGTQIAAMRTGGQASMVANQQAAQQRAAEQLAAEQQVGALLGQEQAAAAGLGGLTTAQAGLEQSWGGMNLQGQLANQASGMQAQQANQANALAVQQANQQAYLDALGVEAGTYEAALAANAGVAQSNLEAETAQRERSQENTQAIFQGLGSGIMASDERSKQRIESLDAENAGLRSALAAAATGQGAPVDAMRTAKASEFEYRPEAYSSAMPAGVSEWNFKRYAPGEAYQPRGAQPAAAPGERMVGVMAQDVAQGDPSMVTHDQGTGQLGINTGQLASAAAAGSSTALQRQDEVEARLAEVEAELQAVLAEREQAAFDDRFAAYQNAERWSGTTPTPSNKPAPWLSEYMGAL